MLHHAHTTSKLTAISQQKDKCVRPIQFYTENILHQKLAKQNNHNKLRLETNFWQATVAADRRHQELPFDFDLRPKDHDSASKHHITTSQFF